MIYNFLSSNTGFIFNLLSFIENIQSIQAVILTIGVLLIFAEIFMPGFGIAGGIGIVMVVAGIILTAQSAAEAVVMFIILFILIAVLLAIVLRSAKKGKLAKTLVLNLSSNKEQGYSSKSDYTEMTGMKGKALTPLRPSGTAVFNGKRFDVVTSGNFIEKDSEIIIVNASEGKIVVEDAAIT